jgi:hypothetical protein
MRSEALAAAALALASLASGCGKTEGDAGLLKREFRGFGIDRARWSATLDFARGTASLSNLDASFGYSATLTPLSSGFLRLGNLRCDLGLCAGTIPSDQLVYALDLDGRFLVVQNPGDFKTPLLLGTAVDCATASAGNLNLLMGGVPSGFSTFNDPAYGLLAVGLSGGALSLTSGSLTALGGTGYSGFLPSGSGPCSGTGQVDYADGSRMQLTAGGAALLALNSTSGVLLGFPKNTVSASEINDRHFIGMLFDPSSGASSPSQATGGYISLEFHSGSATTNALNPESMQIYPDTGTITINPPSSGAVWLSLTLTGGTYSFPAMIDRRGSVYSLVGFPLSDPSSPTPAACSAFLIAR